MRFRFLSRKIQFPHPETADANGIVAIGGDLCVARLLLAYRNGIFPWYSDEEPILWWSPDPRFVLFPNQFKVRKSLAKVIRQGRFEIRYDTAFEEVISACSALPRPGQEGTWITREMQEAYIRLHREGVAHSVETWMDGELAGGLYGVAMGPFFFGESMFYRKPNAGKIALAALVDRYKDAPFIDCQAHNDFFESMGATHIPRTQFLATLEAHIDDPSPWTP